MSMVQFQPKGTTEVKNLAFDFISQLAVGETISTKAVVATTYSGVDASPSNVINSAASSSGTIVTQSVKAGVAGVIYKLVCTITTSASQTLTITGYLPVILDPL